LTSSFFALNVFISVLSANSAYPLLMVHAGRKGGNITETPGPRQAS
jgi:hypothetical protein